MPARKPRKVKEMASEYRFDYKKAKPNRFAEKMKNEPIIILLDDDVAKVFPRFIFNGTPFVVTIQLILFTNPFVTRCDSICERKLLNVELSISSLSVILTRAILI